MIVYQLCCEVETDCSRYIKNHGVSENRKYLQEVADALNEECRQHYFIKQINTKQEAYFYVKVVKKDGRLCSCDLKHSLIEPMGEAKEEFYNKHTYYIKQLPNETAKELMWRAK